MTGTSPRTVAGTLSSCWRQRNWTKPRAQNQSPVFRGAHGICEPRYGEWTGHWGLTDRVQVLSLPVLIMFSGKLLGALGLSVLLYKVEIITPLSELMHGNGLGQSLAQSPQQIATMITF